METTLVYNDRELKRLRAHCKTLLYPNNGKAIFGPDKSRQDTILVRDYEMEQHFGFKIISRDVVNESSTPHGISYMTTLQFKNEADLIMFKLATR